MREKRFDLDHGWFCMYFDNGENLIVKLYNNNVKLVGIYNNASQITVYAYGFYKVSYIDFSEYLPSCDLSVGRYNSITTHCLFRFDGTPVEHAQNVKYIHVYDFGFYKVKNADKWMLYKFDGTLMPYTKNVDTVDVYSCGFYRIGLQGIYSLYHVDGRTIKSPQEVDEIDLLDWQAYKREIYKVSIHPKYSLYDSDKVLVEGFENVAKMCISCGFVKVKYTDHPHNVSKVSLYTLDGAPVKNIQKVDKIDVYDYGLICVTIKDGSDGGTKKSLYYFDGSEVENAQDVEDIIVYDYGLYVVKHENYMGLYHLGSLVIYDYGLYSLHFNGRGIDFSYDYSRGKSIYLDEEDEFLINIRSTPKPKLADSSQYTIKNSDDIELCYSFDGDLLSEKREYSKCVFTF